MPEIVDTPPRLPEPVTGWEMAAVTALPLGLIAYTSGAGPVVSSIAGMTLLSVLTRGAGVFAPGLLAWIGTPRERQRWRNRRKG